MAQNLFFTAARPALPGAVSVLAGACILLGAVVAADLATGRELGLAPCYLIVVLAVTWYAGGLAGGVFTALAAAALLVVGAIAGHPYSRPLYFAVNVLGDVFIMALMVLLTSRLRAAHDREHRNARIDPLTRLPNRTLFREALTLELARLQRFQRPFALVYVTCEDSQLVQAKEGDAARAALLRTVGETIDLALRRTDFCARLGGDEFALVLPETDASACGIVVEQVRARLIEAMRAGRWQVAFSVGAAIFTQSVTGVDEALARVDELMQRVKQRGRNGLLIETDGQPQRELAAA